MPTYKELMAEKALLEQRLEEVRANEVAGVIKKIQALMAEYDLSVDDVAPKRRRGRPSAAEGSGSQKKPALPPKYMDPKTGATWSGRGRAPSWIGKNRNRFLIDAA